MQASPCIYGWSVAGAPGSLALDRQVPGWEATALLPPMEIRCLTSAYAKAAVVA